MFFLKRSYFENLRRILRKKSSLPSDDVVGICIQLVWAARTFAKTADAFQADQNWPKQIQVHRPQDLPMPPETICNRLEDVIKFLDGEQLVLSKIEVITKERAGKVKKRIVLNTKKSRVAESSSKIERVVLPRALDSVWDLLDLMAEAGIDVTQIDDQIQQLSRLNMYLLA